MKKVVLCIVLLCVCALTPVFAAGDSPRIAVYVKGSKEIDENKALMALVLDAFVRSARYVAASRSYDFIDLVSANTGGSVDENGIISSGAQIGAGFVCIVDVTKAFGTYQLSARIIDVAAARVTATGVTSSGMESMEEMVRITEELVMKMAAPAQQAASAAQPEYAPLQAVSETAAQQAAAPANAPSEKYRGGNSFGIRFGYLDAIDAAATLTLATQNRRGMNARVDIMAGYYGFPYKHKCKENSYEPSTCSVDATKDLQYNSFQLAFVLGGQQKITSDGAVVGHLSPAFTMNFEDERYPTALGFGIQTGLEYIGQNYVFGVDWRPIVFWDYNNNYSGGSEDRSGWKYTIGMSIRRWI
ncbi:MAG: hypothetical protein FWC23_03870 [Chitinispirillia bacterium]|nr:hypothetical protein [Chitinispirillia bacterium]MCL2268308.1 hypothetical protein [Chitinispirillia bacterium]